MDLAEFISSDDRTAWIEDCGLDYYVRKSIRFKGMIELANVTAKYNSPPGGMWKFLRKYKDIPFMMENVINPSLAKYVRSIGWVEVGNSWPIPSFYSPTAVSLYPEATSHPLGLEAAREIV